MDKGAGEGRVVVGWVDRDGRQRVFREGHGVVIGFVRQFGTRWFAESAQGLPIEGTYRRRKDAVTAVVSGVQPPAESAPIGPESPA